MRKCYEWIENIFYATHNFLMFVEAKDFLCLSHFWFQSDYFVHIKNKMWKMHCICEYAYCPFAIIKMEMKTSKRKRNRGKSRERNCRRQEKTMEKSISVFLSVAISCCMFVTNSQKAIHNLRKCIANSFLFFFLVFAIVICDFYVHFLCSIHLKRQRRTLVNSHTMFTAIIHRGIYFRKDKIYNCHWIMNVFVFIISWASFMCQSVWFYSSVFHSSSAVSLFFLFSLLPSVILMSHRNDFPSSSEAYELQQQQNQQFDHWVVAVANGKSTKNIRSTKRR